MKNQLDKFVNINEIINPEQSGFRKCHSCETAVQQSIISWRKDLDKGLFIGVVFIDFARAFETINRSTLLKILHKLGIVGVVLQWFRSYLDKRKQKVKFKDQISDEEEVKYGVPQGSKLGPLLFIIYINEIITVLKRMNIDCRLFADDMRLSISGYNIKEIEIKMNNALKMLCDWMKVHQLKINVNKTAYIIIHDQRFKDMNEQCTLLVNDKKLKYVNETKYLGIILDDKLNFKSNANYVSRKIAKKN